ncbi:hydroxymethylbilane synthase [Patulibacter sp. NPDC049589]|uniref:hydroxymethylbilane synthase n=1 Tax=Patulibacter sp. NPDC049589 TaxID=3154731 RepID=UPI003432BCEA
MIRLGSRRSPLALVQARTVAAALRAAGHEVQIVEVVTTGDRDRAAPDKAKWVTELERGLVAGDVDLAVHSAKDVPGDLPEGLELVAASVREDFRDVLIGAPSLDALPDGARVGTASLRRAAQLLAARPDLTIVAARGNVDTRLARLEPGHADRLDAIVLAAAGLARLGRTPADVVALEGPAFVAAPGQGTLTIEGRTGDAASAAAAAVIHDDGNWACLRAERAVARALGADCTSAVGAHCRSVDGGYALTGFVGAPDGSGWALDEREGDDPEALGALVAERLLRAGGAELLAAARAAVDPAASIAEQHAGETDAPA